MMDFILCSNGKIHSGGRELLEQWRQQSNSWLWIDLQDEDPAEEKAFLTEELGIDEIAIMEAQRPRHPPRFDKISDYFFVLTKPLTSESDSLEFDTLQLAIFLQPRLLVTRHSRDSRYIANLKSDLASGANVHDSPVSLVAAITRRLTQRYGEILLKLEHRLDEIEDEIFASKTDRLLKELVGYNTALRKMRRILAYHTNVFLLMRDGLKTAEFEQYANEFDDIYNLMQRYFSLAELYQNVINDLIEGYISLSAHHLNQIMKVLTVVTVIFVPLTLLVGIYGMNFEYIPELKSRYGYFILLISMFFIASGLLVLFKKVRWL